MQLWLIVLIGLFIIALAVTLYEREMGRIERRILNGQRLDSVCRSTEQLTPKKVA